MLIAGIVLYNPDICRLKENISAIRPQVDKIVLIENGSSDLAYLDSFTYDLELIVNNENMGIAYALNQVMQFAQKQGAEWALTLDQDSVVPNNLIYTYLQLISLANVGMISCKIVDRNFGETAELKNKISGYEEVLMCITSASMLKVSAWNEVGGFANEFFIDSVDFDMCLLLREHGYKIIRTYDTVLLHEVGHSQLRKLLGKEYLVYHHAPIRYYYMIRNNIYLGKRHHFLFHAILRACRQLTMVLLYEDKKSVKLNLMLKGIYHAIIGKYGKYGN